MRVRRGPRALALALLVAASVLSAQNVSSALSAPTVSSSLSATTVSSSPTVSTVTNTLSALNVSTELRVPNAPNAARASNAYEPYASSDADSLSAKPGTYCSALEQELEAEPRRRWRAPVPATPLWLLGSGAARAAHHLLAAVLRAGLTLPPSAVRVSPAPEDLCSLLNHTREKHQELGSFPLSVAAAWRGEPCVEPEPEFYLGLGAAHLAVQSGAAPVTRQLLACRVADAAADCREWPAFGNATCRFLAPRDERLPGELPPSERPSDWPNCTCSSNHTECITLVVAMEKGGAEDAARLARELCAGAALAPVPPLRAVPLPPAALRRVLRDPARSFLFVDYDWWADAAPDERVEPVPELPCEPGACEALAPAVSMLVAPLKVLKKSVPRALSVLPRFRPATATLRRLLSNESALGVNEAACEAALAARDFVRHWLDYPAPPVLLYILPCGHFGYRNAIENVIADYWKPTGTNVTLHIDNATVGCDDVEDTDRAFHDMADDWLVTRVAGAVVMGASGEGAARDAARRAVPVLGAAPGACAASPDGARLLAALDWLLEHCGWQRLAVLRDEARAAKWQNFLNSSSLVVHEEELGARGAEPALEALRALDARVVVLDAGAAKAKLVLEAAAAADMTPARGFAWLVLRAAGEDADWAPPAGFEYATLSGWWRGGPGAPGGSARLRAAAERRLGPRWPPLAAPLLDAILLMMTGIEYFLATDPKFPDEHNKNIPSQMLARLTEMSVAGVAQPVSCGSAPRVFVHRWSADDATGRLLAVWPVGGSPAQCPQPGLRGAAPCHTTRSGDGYAPSCHDGAWALAIATLALAPPALWAAAAGRRARLRRRDRALAHRLATAALEPPDELRAHLVPRSALELLDELGAGHYGSVRLGLLRRARGPPLAVAAKAPRGGDPDAGADLLCEAALLARLRHKHVVRLAGAVLGGAGAPPLLLMEHALHGDLWRYLRTRRTALERALAGETEPEAVHVGAAALTRLAREAAAACGYLALHGVVHRDVRAANCLVDSRRTLKLADFGLARRPDGAEYLCRRRTMLPVLWMAPESLAGGTFSPASDVWALGVLMLELVTLGARPFGAWPAPRALRHVRTGGAPPLPSDAAASTRGVLATCWRRAPAERPTAAQLVAWLAAHPRALRPALAPPAGGRGGAAPGPEPALCLDEWTA